MADYGLSDEIVAISSIYGDDILAPDIASSAPSAQPSDYIFRVPQSSGVALRLRFSADYPALKPPEVVTVVSSGEHMEQGHGKEVMEVVRDVIGEKFVADQPVMFEVLEALGELGELLAAAHGGTNEDRKETLQEHHLEETNDTVVDHSHAVVEWVASEVVTEKRSTFVAHACRVSDAAEAKTNVRLLITSDKKFEKATHNINAFKGRFAVRDGSGERERELVFQDCDDDGEDAAGGRLLHLLELTGAENVLVVVSRWYGGIKLGPDRFRIINQVARDALVRGGWVKEGRAKNSKKTK